MSDYNSGKFVPSKVALYVAELQAELEQVKASRDISIKGYADLLTEFDKVKAELAVTQDRLEAARRVLVRHAQVAQEDKVSTDLGLPNSRWGHVAGTPIGKHLEGEGS